MESRTSYLAPSLGTVSRLLAQILNSASPVEESTTPVNPSINE